jgi:hypothetical protein
MRIIFILILLVLTSCNNKKTLPGKVSKKLICSLPKELKLDKNYKLKVIVVITTWSLKAQVQVKRFQKVKNSFKTNDVGFILVFTDFDQRIVIPWYKQFAPEFISLHDPGFSLCKKKIIRVPTTIIMNSKNRICYIYNGIVSSPILLSQILEAKNNCK